MVGRILLTSSEGNRHFYLDNQFLILRIKRTERRKRKDKVENRRRLEYFPFRLILYDQPLNRLNSCDSVETTDRILSSLRKLALF